MKISSLSKTVGHNIRQCRVKENMKGETLARELGITKAAVSQMENGLTDIKVSTLYKISAIFKIDVGRLVTG